MDERIDNSRPRCAPGRSSDIETSRGNASPRPNGGRPARLVEASAIGATARAATRRVTDELGDVVSQLGDMVLSAGLGETPGVADRLAGARVDPLARRLNAALGPVNRGDPNARNRARGDDTARAPDAGPTARPAPP